MKNYNPNSHHRRSIRLKGYDYSQTGLYFVTICTRNREHLFGEIRNEEMVLNEYGKIAHNEWLKTPNIRSNVQLGEFIVMPNHIHGIIVITEPRRGVLHTPLPTNATNDNEDILSEIVPNAIEGVCNTPLRTPSQTIGAIVRGYKTAVTKQLNQITCFGTIWQTNYYEHIIRNNYAYQYISNYIINNPKTWKKDSYCGQ